MNSLVFLLARSMKNSLLETLRKPAKLTIWLILVIVLGGILAISIFVPREQKGLTDLIWMQSGLFAILVMFFTRAVKQGLSTGNTLFDMSDVNLLFVSPLNPRTILVYGIVRVAKTASFVVFFLLFQSPILTLKFGIGVSAILLLLLGFVLATSLMQIISLTIYSLTVGNPARKRAAGLIAVATHVPLTLALIIPLLRAGDFAGSVQQAIRSNVFSWTPVTGWASKGALALITGDAGTGWLLYGLMVIAGALLLLSLAFNKLDYYEDVLVATETTFQKIRAFSEGQIHVDALGAKNVSVAKTGVGGSGASAIFFKHMRESFRMNRLGLWGTSSFLIAAIAIAIAFFSRGKDISFMGMLYILMLMQVFMIGTGRGLKELYSHYIYMIPDGPTRKIIWSNLEIVMKVAVESVVIFVATGIILHESPLRIAAAILAYTLFSFLLLGVNYLSLRWTGANINVGLLLLIYMYSVILIMLPGIVGALLTGFFMGKAGVLVGMLELAAWEFITGLGCFALSRGILHRCDMPSLANLKT
ncbi:MAG: putative ABC exporter domain-containing protein [Acidobacteria bacterium]|nr:putative ABC exporter domain-containing protein [Acidobacteriota bacterium]